MRSCNLRRQRVPSLAVLSEVSEICANRSPFAEFFYLIGFGYSCPGFLCSGGTRPTNAGLGLILLWRRLLCPVNAEMCSDVGLAVFRSPPRACVRERKPPSSKSARSTYRRGVARADRGNRPIRGNIPVAARRQRQGLRCAGCIPGNMGRGSANRTRRSSHRRQERENLSWGHVRGASTGPLASTGDGVGVTW